MGVQYRHPYNLFYGMNQLQGIWPLLTESPCILKFLRGLIPTRNHLAYLFECSNDRKLKLELNFNFSETWYLIFLCIFKNIFPLTWYSAAENEKPIDDSLTWARKTLKVREFLQLKSGLENYTIFWEHI